MIRGRLEPGCARCEEAHTEEGWRRAIRVAAQRVDTHTFPPQETVRDLAACESLELAARESREAVDFVSTSFLIVEAGVVAVVASCDGARRKVVAAVAGAGDILPPPSARERILAITDARVKIVPDTVCRGLLASPDIAGAILARLLRAVADRQRTIGNFAAVAAGDRLRAKLVQLAGAHGRVAADGVYLELPLTHQLLAETIGSARETVTGAVARLEEQGFLVREDGRYVLAVVPDSCEQ